MQFHKYQGAGNDFILLDARLHLPFPLDDAARIAALCDRRFGIGADGLMLLREKEGHDFEMIYYNSDGGLSGMCGNGGRCITKFAAALGIERETYRFVAADGPHESCLLPNGRVRLKMIDVAGLECHPDHYLVNTGSPHYVRYVEDSHAADIVGMGRAVRYGEIYGPRGGINVNLVSPAEDGTGLLIATYERGVEDETLACGTGVTAAALTFALRRGLEAGRSFHIPVRARGGQLHVDGRVDAAGTGYENIWLTGPAEMVFRGNII